MAPRRSEDSSLRNPISEDLPGPTASGRSLSCSPRRPTSRRRSSRPGCPCAQSSEPSTSGHQISYVASEPCSPALPATQFLCPSSPALTTRQYKKQLKQCDTLIRECPENVLLRIFRAQTLVEMGRLGDAIDEYHRAKELHSEETPCFRNFLVSFNLSLFNMR
jgi:hypothetical protein